MKDLPTFDADSAVVIFHFLNINHQDTILTELKGILEQAKILETHSDIDFEYGATDLPQLGLRLAIPKIPGQDTQQFKKWPYRMQFRHKCLHIECSTVSVKMVQTLVKVAKQRNMFQPL